MTHKIQLKASYFVLAGLFGPLIFMAPELQEEAEYAETNRAQLLQAEQSATEKIELANREVLNSDVALARIAGACIPVLDYETKEIRRFVDGGNVIASTDAKNGLTQSFEDGVCVANSLGDTAIVRNGVMTDLARVGPEDLTDYTTLFDQQAGAY